MKSSLKSTLDLISIFSNIIYYIKKARNNLDPSGQLPKKLRNEYLQNCSSDIFNKLEIKTYCNGIPIVDEASIFVGNHISYLDIILLLKYYQVVFVAKKEVSKWPIISSASHYSKTIFVDRAGAQSRKEARLQIARKIKEQGDSVALFPSGTTSISKEPSWRWGSFELAKEFKIPVVPFRIKYNQVQKIAFIGEDSFIPHLWTLTKEKNLEAIIEFSSPVFIEDVSDQVKTIQNWCQSF